MNVQGTLGEYGNVLLQSELEHNRAFIFKAMRVPWLARMSALNFNKAFYEDITLSLNQRLQSGISGEYFVQWMLPD